VKTMRRRRLVKVRHRVVFGTLDAIEHVLLAWGRKINTAFVECLNLTLRQHVPAVGRRVNTLCQVQDGLRQQLVGTTIVRPGMIGVLTIGCQGRKRSKKI
jgi:hypothetical protein